MALVTPDTPPRDILADLRGLVTGARLTYPERVHLPVIDEHGGRWLLATWEAMYEPADPGELDGKIVAEVEFDERSQVLTVGFSDGTDFTVTPIPDDDKDAIENWELFTPDGMLLIYGPWGKWEFRRATTRADFEEPHP